VNLITPDLLRCRLLYPK